jgi:hypothetical protein
VYLVHVEGRLREESSRGNAYLDYSTRTPLINCVERQLIANHAQTLLDRGAGGWWHACRWFFLCTMLVILVLCGAVCSSAGFFALCDEPRLDSIALMFNLLCRVGAVEPIRATFVNYIVVRDMVLLPPLPEHVRPTTVPAAALVNQWLLCRALAL